MRAFIIGLLAWMLSLYTYAQSDYNQKVDYHLTATFLPDQNIVQGFATITYTNYAPTALDTLPIHIWPNAYQNNNTAYAQQMIRFGNSTYLLSAPHERGGLYNYHFQQNGKDVQVLPHPTWTDVIYVILNKAIQPFESTTLTTPFTVKIPKLTSRLGYDKDSTYALTQWYPKVAKYGKAGFHVMPYLDLGEYYNDFGQYQLDVTYPKGWVVLASGQMDSATKAYILDTSLRYQMGDSIHSTFTINHASDMAWFASKKWIIDHDTLLANQTLIDLFIAYRHKNTLEWKGLLNEIKKEIKQVEKDIGNYLYPSFTAVEGELLAGGGMEYPSITVINANDGLVQETVLHELRHNWFQGMIGSNERDEPWLDEGINTFYDDKLQDNQDLIGPLTLTIIKNNQTLGKDQSILSRSTELSYTNYGLDIYRHAAAYVNWLEVLLGPQQFKLWMQSYYRSFALGHPNTQALISSLQQYTNKDFQWFYDALKQSHKGFDIALKKGRYDGKSWYFKVINNHRIPVEVPIEIVYKDNDKRATNVVLHPGKNEIQITNELDDPQAYIRLSKKVPDLYGYNNVLKIEGNKAFRPWRFVPFFNASTQSGAYKTALLPLIGWNYYNGFQLGLSLHNLEIPSQRFQYFIGPKYAFHNQQWVGDASIGYRWDVHQKRLNNVLVQLDVQRYTYDQPLINNHSTPLQYLKWKPQLTLNFNSRGPIEFVVDHYFKLAAYHILEDQMAIVGNELITKKQTEQYLNLQYKYANTRPFAPYSYQADIQFHQSFAKLFLQAKTKINYSYLKQGLEIGGHVAKLWSKQNLQQRHALVWSKTGVNDYLYDEHFLARSEITGFWSHQNSWSGGHGFLTTPLYITPLGYSDNWMLGIHLVADMPFKNSPLQLYANAVTYNQIHNIAETKWLFNGGFVLSFPNIDLWSVQVPLLMSKAYRDYFQYIDGNKFLGPITFSIKFDKLNKQELNKVLYKANRFIMN